MTEYFDDQAPKTGIMRTLMDSTYTETVKTDRERAFLGYDFDIIYVFYPTSSTAYVTAIDALTGYTYLIYYDFFTASFGATLWHLRGW